jgi:ABC-type polysaccharide/polyol phosphate export permease
VSVAAPEYDSARLPHPMVREASELLRYRDLVRQLVTRNIKVRYKRSALGFVWSMLGPLLSMAALSLVFTQIFRPTTPQYPLYLFPGLLLWTFFAQTTSTIVAEVIGGVDLWRRIYTPRTVFAVATTVTGLIHLGLAMVPLILLMLVFGAPLTTALIAAPLAAICTAMFALGVGLAVASIAGYFADVGDLFQVLLGTWLYFTPVIYPRAILPERYHWVWDLNPMTHLVDAFRMPFYQHTAGPLELLLVTLATGGATCAAGWWLFTHSADDLVRRT